MEIASDRTTKYVTAVRRYMADEGHATNAQIIEALRAQFPDVSATTIHRVTTRLHERGELQLAPAAKDGAMRFDANVAPHDHFSCEHCGLLRDAQLSQMLGPLVEQAIGDGCSISGSLTVSGLCKACRRYA